MAGERDKLETVSVESFYPKKNPHTFSKKIEDHLSISTFDVHGSRIDKVGGYFGRMPPP